MTRRTLPLLAIAAATVTTAVITSAPAAQDAGFALESRLEQSSFVRIEAPPKGPSAGDVYVLTASLKRDGAAAGRAEYVQTVVDKRYRGIMMQIQLLLPDGSIALQGSGLGKRAPGTQPLSAQGDLAITGGTGAYAGASGVVHVKDTSETTQRLDVALAG